MSFRFLNEGQRGNIQEFTPIDTFIDPVSKIRVSNPSNLIDTDFEYGLQPTKWETVELINNTPAFFSKSGDTTISDITGITTNSGTREVTVTTAFPHNLAVGIPIRVSGTKSVTADGSYIINATPTDTTFTYLARANQEQTISIFDLYTSVITGEFFQGSQISINDAEGIVTNSAGPISTLTVKTPTKHGFGLNTPFYFLNLNSTISQEFESQNSASLSFDPSNSATAQTFDGSNTLLQTPVDLSNSATTSNFQSIITSTNPIAASITVALSGEDWSVLKIGSPLYHSVSVGGGYFQQNPRGVVFIKNVDQINQSGGVATFQVSQIPDGPAIPILANMTGFFQIANQARTFAGNNINPETQIDLEVEVGQEFLFDGGNQGFDGESDDPPSNTGTVVGYTGTTVTVFTSQGSLDYYNGAMVRYSSSETPATGLTNNRTYFVLTFTPGPSAGLFNMTIAEFPGGSAISISGGSGTQEFSKIGVSLDKDIVHIRDSSFEEGDMLEYSYPENGRFSASSEKDFYFVETVYDIHNYTLTESLFTPISATGGTTTEIFSEGRLWKVHSFTNTGTGSFAVQDVRSNNSTVEYLIVAGGGAGGNSFPNTTSGGGGGAGGIRSGTFNVSQTSYSVIVGAGGSGGSRPAISGQNSSVFGVSSIGGGRGGSWQSGGVAADVGNGGSGGGNSDTSGATTRGLGTAGPPRQGQNGGLGQGYVGSVTLGSGAGGGRFDVGFSAQGPNGADAGRGFVSYITGSNVVYSAGGGGGGNRRGSGSPGISGNGGGFQQNGAGAVANRGGGGGGAGGAAVSGSGYSGGAGGSGIVVIRYPITPPPTRQYIFATGGETSTLTRNGIIYRVHQFKNVGSSNFVVTEIGPTKEYRSVEYLIVGGGASGGSYVGGGGGGGGVRGGFFELTSAQTYSVIVGAGGAAAGSTTQTLSVQGNGGASSSIFGITASGGGGGGRYAHIGGSNGASGGGSGGFQDSEGSGGTGIAGQGFAGGGAFGPRPRSFTGGGGGGGAMGHGRKSDNAVNSGGDGGPGILNEILGQAWYWGGGGGGGNFTDGARPGNGGIGGGGGGSSNSANVAGIGGGSAINNTSGGNGSPSGDPNNRGGSGAPNSGGGGGGNGHYGLSGAGGSGIVVIRYPIGVVL
jgi:hypothetical protein